LSPLLIILYGLKHKDRHSISYHNSIIIFLDLFPGTVCFPIVMDFLRVYCQAKYVWQVFLNLFSNQAVTIILFWSTCIELLP